MPGDVRLNLGCGAAILPQYINVDDHPGEGIDLVCDIRNLPYENDTITQILMIHVIEHFSFDDALKIIRKCFDILKPKGQLLIEAPDVFKTIKDARGGEFDAINSIFGDLSKIRNGQDNMNHRWGWTGPLMQHQLATVGFDTSRGVEEGIGHGRPWRDFRVIGIKP